MGGNSSMPCAKGREPPGCNYITERKMQTENQRTKTQKEEKNVGMLDSLVKTCVRPLGENWTFCERSSTNLTPRKKETLCKIRQQQKAIVCKQNLVLRSAPVTSFTCFTRCLASPRPLLLNDSACRGRPLSSYWSISTASPDIRCPFPDTFEMCRCHRMQNKRVFTKINQVDEVKH